MGECGTAGPGPGRYGAPTTVGFIKHDFTKIRQPAYSLGIKKSISLPFVTPAPYKYNNVDRNGRYPYLGYSIGLARRPSHIAQQAGPANYYYQEKNKQGYSFGLLAKTKTDGIGPGPAYYWQPKPQSGWSMQKRYATKMTVTPGPYSAVDPNKYKKKAPTAPIGIKTLKTNNQTPGPGPAFYPKLSTKPGYSFGLRHPCTAPPLITYGDNNTRPY